ncbi:MAG: ornithine carbamoyltransferase [Burkholderiales bacterium]|nr:ornithine carbamoyltransferase [Burkholderiales bacterium]
MVSSLHLRSLPAAEVMLPHELNAVLATARALQAAAQAGTPQMLLRGKKLGLLCEAADSVDAALFQRAALGLGAHVAHVWPQLSELNSRQQVLHTARVLGQLYDAVECQGMAPALVAQLRDDAGVPVFEGAALDSHPTAALAALLDGPATAADKRCFVLQAVLVSTLA